MQLKEHIVYGGTASLILTPFFGVKSIYFFIASILIDSDHYVDFLYFSRFRNWSVKSMFRFHGQLKEWKVRDNFMALEAFHTVEFIFSILILGIYFQSTELVLVFSGMVFHMFLDLIRLYQYKAIPLRALSFIEYWLRARKMRSAGIDPEKLFHNAYAISRQKAI